MGKVSSIQNYVKPNGEIMGVKKQSQITSGFKAKVMMKNRIYL